MVHCINTSHPDYQLLLKQSGIKSVILKAKIASWIQNNTDEKFPSLEELNITPNTVNSTLKIIDALEKIQRNVFTQDKLQGWINDLQKQGVPAQQLEIFKEVAKPGMTKDEIITSIAANYSYTVEINISKERDNIAQQEANRRSGLFTEEELENTERNTGYYSNLTVPGGINYTEQEIATPGITPSIKGHAQFATDNGIGWFRSDEISPYSNTLGLDVDAMSEKEYDDYLKNYPKVRRILEVQSDLFQKGRSKEQLIALEDKEKLENRLQTLLERQNRLGENALQKNNKEILEIQNRLKNIPVLDTQNQFLQLLNKDNNWVTFFVKSIIQDSAKKGYEKVLFPTGNTASKVEGHTTLEEFKKQKEDRIKVLEAGLNLKPDPNIDFTKYSFRELKDMGYDYLGNEDGKAIWKPLVKDKTETLNEINQLKQELERVEGPQGFGALRPIYNFYENTVTNILKKQYGKENVRQVTDEYGNTWNEVNVKVQPTNNTILYQTKTPNQVRLEILKKVKADSKGLINPHKYGELLKLVGDYNKEQGRSVLQINKTTTDKLYLVISKDTMLQQTSTMEERVEDLDNKLKSWAKKHGISVETMEAVMQKYPERYNNSALGLADFINNLIAVADDAKIDTLPEEIAHFAIEILSNNPEIQQALEEVVTTDEYAKVKEEYKNIYNKEEDFRKEALGKILSKQIVKQYKKENTKGFWNNVKQIINSFKEWLTTKFDKTTESRKYIDNVLQPLVKSILNEEYLGEVKNNNQQTLYNIPNQNIEHKKEFLKQTIDKLKQRLIHLQRSAKSQEAIRLLEKEILEIEKSIHKGESDLGISALITLADSELTAVISSMEKARNTGKLNTNTIKNTELFVSMYEDIFNTLMESLYTFEATKEEIDEIKKNVEGIYSKLKDARGLNTSLSKKASIEIVDKGNTNEYGEKIDPDFDAKTIVEATHEDMSYWRLLVGNYKYADSKIIKAAHKIIFDSVAKVKRFTAQTGNKILSKQEAFLAAGNKIEQLIEKDDEGNLTHYFVREYHWDKYYKELEKTKQNITKLLGYEDYSQINPSLLSAEDNKKYKQQWAIFFENNTTKTTEFDNATGTTKVVVRPNSKYKNARYTELMSDPVVKDYYEELIKTKREAVDKLPVNYRTERLVYMVPPILKTTLNRLSSKEGFLTKVSKLGKEAFFITKDDTQFGENANFKHVNYLNKKMVPIYFTRPLEDINDVSMDVARSVTLFAEMAENYKQMNTIAGDLGVIQSTLAQRNYFTNSKRDTTKKGIETNEYSALETLMDTHVFGIERNPYSVTIPSNSLTEKLGIANQDFSGTKFSQRLTSFIRNNNLAFNITTSLSGWLKGTGDSIIEDAIGLYTTTESKNWARLEFTTNLMQVVGEIGKAKQSNKMHLILQEAETVNLDTMLKNSNSSRFARKVLTKDVFYTTFATGDYGIKGRTTLAIYDNIRLYNNQFMTKAKFQKITALQKGVKNDKAHQKEVQKQWEELRDKSLYNAYGVIDGQLSIKPEFKQYVTESVLNSAKGKVEHVTTYIDGTLSPTDKGKLARTIAGDFILMHRGWFIGMIDTRFKREGVNNITEEEEIGMYRATASYLKNVFWDTLVKEKSLAPFAVYRELTPAKQRAVLKTGLDAFYLLIVSVVAALANMAADDDDDETFHIQYTAYQLNRLLMEQGAAWSPSELIQMIDEPVVGARFIKDVTELSESVNFNETYKRGMYEGKSHATKWWLKKLPTRNLYELQFPKLKNNFIKQLVDSKMYDLLSPNQTHSIFSTESFKEELIPFNEGYFNDEPINVTPAVEELEQDYSGEYNEFN